ncbi:testis-expressed protein 54 [Anolis sagrei]|uniref:testis-expressed protein 54 n=1 Tax=Anolis sagrei TaxID=38937 RepID=UPI003522DE3A
MGCVESSEALHSDEHAARETPPTPPTTPPLDKGRKKKRYSIRSKHSTGKKPSLVPENLKQPSQNTKITVIWRRYSAFGRRESMKSTKSQLEEEEEEAGPSQKPKEEEPKAEPSSP